jgi:hypothetical protein
LDGDDDDGGGMLGNIFPQLVKGYAENPEAAVGLVTDLFRKLTSQ